MTAKTRLKGEAHAMYRKGFTQKEIAKTLGLSEKTLTEWQKKGKWKLINNDELNEACNELVEALLIFKETKPVLVRLVKSILLINKELLEKQFLNTPTHEAT